MLLNSVNNIDLTHCPSLNCEIDLNLCSNTSNTNSKVIHVVRSQWRLKKFVYISFFFSSVIHIFKCIDIIFVIVVPFATVFFLHNNEQMVIGQCPRKEIRWVKIEIQDEQRNLQIKRRIHRRARTLLNNKIKYDKFKMNLDVVMK